MQRRRRLREGIQVLREGDACACPVPVPVPVREKKMGREGGADDRSLVLSEG